MSSNSPLIACLPRLVLLSCLLGACRSWQVESAPLPEVLGRPGTSGRMRLTLIDGTIRELDSPQIRGDSLVGAPVPGGDGRRNVAVFGGGPEDASISASGTAPGILLADIAGVERRRVSAGKTTGLVLGVAAVGVGIFYLATVAAISDFSFDCHDFNPPSCDSED